MYPVYNTGRVYTSVTDQVLNPNNKGVLVVPDNDSGAGGDCTLQFMDENGMAIPTAGILADGSDPSETNIPYIIPITVHTIKTITGGAVVELF